MGFIDISQIDKIDDPELRKIIKDIYETTDDENEQARLIDEKLMELENKKYLNDPFRPFISIKALVFIVLLVGSFSVFAFYNYYHLITYYPGISSRTGEAYIALAFGIFLPVFMFGLLIYFYVKHKRRVF